MNLANRKRDEQLALRKVDTLDLVAAPGNRARDLLGHQIVDL